VDTAPDPAPAVDPRLAAALTVQLGPDLGPGADPATAAWAITGVAVALELVDLAGPADDPVSVVAANVYHRAVAFGRSRPAPLPAGIQGRLLVDGRVIEAAPVPAGVTDRVGAAARLLAAMGERLLPGDRVLTGSVVQVPVGPGHLVGAELGPLGRWSCPSRRDRAAFRRPGGCGRPVRGHGVRSLQLSTTFL
jgi:2-keto-4-pentenoate hydratase